MATPSRLNCLIDRRFQPPGIASLLLEPGVTLFSPAFGAFQLQQSDSTDDSSYDSYGYISAEEIGLDEIRQFTEVPGIDNVDFDFSDSPILQHLKSLVTNVVMPRSWVSEGIESPTIACERFSCRVLCRLFETYGVIPYKVTMSKDGGILAAFRNPHNKNILRIEIDNDLDVVAVVSDGEAILASGLLDEDDTEQSIFAAFDSRLAGTFSMQWPGRHVARCVHYR